MKKSIFLSMTFALLPLSLMAQDDMYFGSTKQKPTTRNSSSYQSAGYYSGSSRNVDEYNRRYSGSRYETLSPDTGDIISFSPVEGTYPDSVGDFALTRKMTRFDDYAPSAAYWEGYDQGRLDSWGWHSPWYYTSSFYPWYDYGWYDPWYHSSWRFGWYDPWYYDYSWRWGWHRPYYYSSYYGWGGGYYHGSLGRGSLYHRNGNTGTLSRYSDHSRSVNSGRVGSYTSSSRFNGARDRAYGSSSSGRSTYSGSTNRSVSRSSTRTNSMSSSSSSTSRSSSYTPSTSYGTSSSSSSSYGSSRSSSGSSYSSGRSSGGGSFSSGRSGGGGGGGRSGGGRR